jgi:hypothetical protein
MGDCFQVVVDRDATQSEAAELATTIHRWLIDEGIVLADPPDCVLSSDVGYRAGPHYEKATSMAHEHLWRLRTNGLDLITKRTVFHSGQGGFELVCVACADRFEPTEQWGEAIDEWHKNKGVGMLACPSCGHTQPITDWLHDPPWGFGNLGFKFWNWPPLRESFVEEIGKRLGHRVVLVAGKL